jgi:hypothetical protein
VKLKNVSWAIAGLALKTTKGKPYANTIYAFNFSFARLTNKQFGTTILAPTHLQT